MKPTTLREGDLIRKAGISHPLRFIKREPSCGSTSAKNIFQCDAWVGQNGPDDKGFCEMSDHDVLRFCSRV